MKILHVVYQSLPNISGSSIRTRDIVMSQKEIGLEPVVVSSPFQNGISNAQLDIIHNIKHYRTYNNNPDDLVKENKSTLYKRFKKSTQIVTFYKKVKKIVKNEKPDIIHAHATFFCAITAFYVGRKFKVPVCYEVRSLWEEREKKQAANIVQKLQPKIITFLETTAMKKSDKVIVINKNLKKEMVSRNIKNIDIIQNGVNFSLIKETTNSSFTGEKIRFGYIGSVSPIEGLDLVARVWKRLEEKGLQNEFHVYGSGTYFENLNNLIESLGLKNFHLHGIIDSEKIHGAFNQIDVIVNARLKSKISDTVTPLKPLEAMAYRKLVVASDVGGMRELIQDNQTGILFKADADVDLEKRILLIIKNGINEQIIESAYNYVYNEKSWRENAKKYHEIYKKLLYS
jgi:glycogen synthase